MTTDKQIVAGQNKTAEKKSLFRVRIGSVVKGKPLSVFEHCDSVKAGVTIGRKACIKNSKHSIIDVEELVSHTWMLRHRWNKVGKDWKQVVVKIVKS